MSVYQLVKELCSELIKENDRKECDLLTAKRIAFEVLLKSNENEKSLNSVDKLVEDFQFCSFELRLAKRNEDADQLEKCVDEIKENGELFVSVSQLLINLKNIDSSSGRENDNFFQLPSSSTLLHAKKNVFLPKTIFNQQQPQLNLNRKSNKKDVSFFTNILNSHIGKKTNEEESLKLKHIEPPKIEIPRANNEKLSLKSVCTWENLGRKEDRPVKLFSSESNEAFIYHHLLTLARSKQSTEIKKVSMIKLINDIKLLMIGIGSESFKRDENTLKFYTTMELACEDISDLSHFIEPFIEMGTCFKRLKTYTSKNPMNQSLIVDGFLFKSFCDRVTKFLNHCRDIIYSQETESLLKLAHSTTKIRKIVTHLALFLNIHPSSPANQIAIPTGSDFLKLLYDEHTRVIDNDLRFFYVELLRSCCEVYYLRYQDWFYKGQLDDPHKELFIISFVDHYSENTKTFFDKAYIIRKQSVPAFLSNCADNVLLCGKYTMLLKSFKPSHPLFYLPKPPIRICLSFGDLSLLKEQCSEFSKIAQKECGEIISIETLLNEKRKAKLEKYRNAEKATARNILKWKKFQEERQQQIREFREMQQQELRKELQQIEERKLVKRLEEIEAERVYMDASEEIELEELEKENQEIREKIKVYRELNGKMDKANESRSKILEKLNDDILNANKEEIVKDDMNNVVEKAKVLSELQRNKLKVLSHEYNFSPINSTNDDEKQRGDEINANISTTASLTDAQRNKLKVMGHEYAMLEMKNEKAQPKINVQDYDKMTDLQRNRMKVLAHEYGESDKEVKEKKSENKQQGPLTELQKNRMKVLSHEFAYFDNSDSNKKDYKKCLSLDLLQPPETTSLLPIKQQLESPMSVTSDHFTNDSNELQHSQTIIEDDDDNESNGTNEDDDVEETEMLKAFEEAVEKNQKMFMGVSLNNTIKFNYEELAITDTMALSQFLQMSLTIPLNAYMKILNNETLKMFIQDLDILSHFKSLRNYFLLMNGEFCSNICHEMFLKLEKGIKPVELLNYQSLHMMLDNALSGSRFDPNTENLSFIVQNSPEKFELHSPAVLNMLTLSYSLEWPLTLILNTETMDQYQKIFNYLLKIKRISWILEECFQNLKESHKQHGSELLKSSQYRNVQHTRHQMTQFVNCLENYVTRNVMQTAWNAFIQDLKSAQSILCIYRKHTNYLKRILFLCLLNRKSFEFYKTIEDVFKVILRFHKHLKSKSWQKISNTVEDSSLKKTTTRTIYIHTKFEKMQNDADDFLRLIRYVLYLGNKIIQHNYQKEIYDLLSMIDINGYYSNR